MSDLCTPARRMTADEFCDWVQRQENEDRHFELVRGEVAELPLSGERHGFVCASVSFILSLFVRQSRKGYVLANNPGVVLERDPDTVLGPDVVFFEKSKKYEELNPKFIEDMPALAVEVLSPNDRPGKLLARAHAFLRSGIRMVWLVDPEACDITVLRPGGKSQGFEKDQELACEDVLPGFRCRVSEFFQVPGEAPGAPAG